MSSPVASHTQNLYLGLPPNGSADYERDYNHNWKILDFIEQYKTNYTISGLAVTAGSGLTVNWAVGSATVNGTSYSISASSGSATDNTADTNIHLPNYVFVNNSGAVTISTSLPTTEYTPLAIVFTNAGAISKVVDCRKYSTGIIITNVTAATYTHTIAEGNGLNYFTNTGAGAGTTPRFDLPAAAEDLVYWYDIVDSGGIEINPNGTETLTVEGTSLGAGTNLICKTVGARIGVFATGTGGWKVVTQNSLRTASYTLASDISITSVLPTWTDTIITVTIICGVSGKIEVNFTGHSRHSASAITYSRINSAAGIIALNKKVSGSASDINNPISGNKVITGLTPGTSYTFTFEGCVDTGGQTMYIEPASYPTSYFAYLTAKTW